MSKLTQIGLTVLAISFLVFIAFFGRLPIFRRTPIAWLYKAIWVTIPQGILAVDDRLSGGRLTSALFRFGSAIMYDRHPTVLIFFVALLLGGEYMYLPGAWPRLSGIHKFFGSISIICPYVFLYLSAYSDPGFVGPDNHTRYMQLYPYDFTLFHPGQDCRTCKLPKPARSKHCSVCKRCVAKMDHHCVFINNCVGYNNHHYFILLLLSTAVLTAYGTLIGLSLISSSVRNHGVNYFTIFPKPAPLTWRDYLILVAVGIQDDVGVGSVTLLSGMTSPLVWGLLAYHIYLIYCGTTTNESMKWQDWQAEMDDGCAFKRSLVTSSPSSSSPHESNDEGVNRVSPAAEKTTPTASRKFPIRHPRWPVDPVQIMVRTDNGRPPPQDAAIKDGPLEGAGPGEWERVWRLKDVENLYDIGFGDNLVDVMIPYHSFRHHRSPSPPFSDLERGRPRRRSGSGADTFSSEEEDEEGEMVALAGGRGKNKNNKNKKKRGKGGKKPKAAVGAAARVVNSAT